ncbi:MAG TPA: asparagine synthase (glutamine-hydrolyzing) [Vicinamibacterales bacterium]|nr:asparagine synthase (glutamine-hydrolyzing) [Vicinamibacterales bacterium]
MCGIAGVVGEPDGRRSILAVRQMCTDLARRGPDAEGTASWDGVVFGHRRLAIFDLSDAGRQPMVTPDNRVGVVFNGAIYNYRELRRSLSAFDFITQTDTEVLLHGYRQWGIDNLVRRLRGMFAFALWDDAARRLYLVRDRLGVKPLVYVIRGGVLAFASTVRALVTSGFTDGVDPEAVLSFLNDGFVPDSLSIYRGVVKVPAGSIVEVPLASSVLEGKVTTRKYWTQPSATSPISFADAVETTRVKLLDAVKVRLHADVPVGALLSGGIDSSLVCWAAQELGASIQAYTIATPGDPWDEAAEAMDTAKRLSLKHSVVEMSDSDLPEVEDLLSAYGEPFACPSALGMLRVSRAISQFSPAKVLLTGDGGDDVFLGYPRHRHLWLASNLAEHVPAVPTMWRRIHSGVPRFGPLRRAGALLDYTTWGLKGYLGHADVLTPQELGSEPESGRTVLTDALRHEFRTRFMSEYLVKVDGATMHHGLEARSPFLDHELWEFASTIPFGVRLHHGQLKAILRELVRTKIGRAVGRRPKRGFGVPVQRWLAGRWRPWAQELLTDSILCKEGWVPASLSPRLTAPLKGTLAPAYQWYAVVLESWLRYTRKDATRRCASR